MPLGGRRLLLLPLWVLLLREAGASSGLGPPADQPPLVTLLSDLDNPKECNHVVPAEHLIRATVVDNYPRLLQLVQFFATHPKVSNFIFVLFFRACFPIEKG